MSWKLFIMLLVFILQAGLLGRSMYVLLSLADLEQDFINPYDLSGRLNAYVMIELAAQVVSLLAVALGRLWFSVLIQGSITAYLLYQHWRKQVYLDSTDAFKQLKPQQRWRTVLFGAYCVSFVFTTYRIIEITIHTILTPEGREVAKRLFKEAAHTLPGY